MAAARWAPLVAFLLASGCLASPTPKSDVDGASPSAWNVDYNLARATGTRAHDFLYSFAMGHPFRNNENPAAKLAAQTYLASTLEAAGVEVRLHKYSPTGTNVLGVVTGTTRPEEWIVLSCHYDIIRSTVYGARDDGLGCAVLLEMARSLSQVPWNRTLVFAFFDEEELGLIGSRALVREHQDSNDSRLVANLNFDPAGLHYPCGDALGTYAVYLFITQTKVEGSGAVPGYAELVDGVEGGFLGADVPTDKVRVGTRHAYLRVGDQSYLPPGSDDDSFDAADIPSIWVGAPPLDEAGPLAVWGYPNHTPPDTAALVEARCGSRELLIRGLQIAMDASLHALRRIDGDAAFTA